MSVPLRPAARRIGLLTATIAISCAVPGSAYGALDDVVREDIEFAQERLAQTAASVPPGRYPSRTGPGGRWLTTGPAEWTSGFFPGSMWLSYAETGDPFWRSQAEARQAGLEGQKRDTSGNDQGFKVFGSFGNGYRQTGDDAYRRVVVRGAESLASRYSAIVGATRSWGKRGAPEFRVIVDNLMNLELLFWASKHGGDPAWYGMALSHALRTARSHVRGDGSTFHVVDYRPRTGRVKRKRTRQGHSRDSTWSRGQAWAIYGFTMAYRESGDPRLLGGARRVAEWFIEHLPPDEVPYWDFDAPRIPDEPRDSSAAAIAASGLLELGALETDRTRAERYRGAADSIIASLSTDRYLSRGRSTEAILLHGTQDKPRGNFDTGLVFGDYYFVEALLRYGSPPEPPYTPSLEVRARGGARLARSPRAAHRFTVRSDEAGEVEAALFARRGTARRLGLKGPPAGILGRGSVELRQPGETTLDVRLKPRAGKRLRRLREARATLSVVLRAEGGRAAATTVSVSV
jgi:unsaturated chondroitin disaccharide hydrolase